LVGFVGVGSSAPTVPFDVITTTPPGGVVARFKATNDLIVEMNSGASHDSAIRWLHGANSWLTGILETSFAATSAEDFSFYDYNGTGGTRFIIRDTTGFVNIISGAQYGFSSSASAADVAPDTGLGRSSAGVVKVTDGSTGIRGFLGGGTAVASATALPLPTGRVIHVTGTTNIDSITSTNFQSGVCIMLIFDDILTVADGSNLKLTAAFVTTADDTLSLCYDGTNFYEQGRSIN